MRDYSLSEIRAINEAYKNMGDFKLYRGIDGSVGNEDGIQSEFGTNLFTTDDVGYAKVYSYDKKNPKIIEYTIDRSKLNIATIVNLDGILGYEIDDLIDGLDDYDTEKVLTNGFNCVYFETTDQDHSIYYLLNKEMVKSQRYLSEDEYDSVEIEP